MGRRRQRAAFMNRRSAAPSRQSDYIHREHARSLRLHMTGLAHRPMRPAMTHNPRTELFGLQDLSKFFFWFSC